MIHLSGLDPTYVPEMLEVYILGILLDLQELAS